MRYLYKGEINWYDAYTSSIGRTYDTNVKYKAVDLDSSYSYSDMDLEFVTGEWDNVLPITISKVSSSEDVVVNVGTFANCKALEPDLSSDAAGTCAKSVRFEGYYMYYTSQKSGYEIVSSTIYVMTDETTHEAHVMMHEMGHSLGWSGHTNNSSDIMYHTDNSNLDLSSKDINHIKQLY